LAAVVGGCVLAGISAHARGDELHPAAEQLHARYAADLEKLAAWCEAQGLAEPACKTRRCLGRRDPYKLYLPVLPKKVGRPRLPPGSPEALLEWDRRLWQLRRDQAEALFQLAQRAVRQQHASLAYSLVLSAIRADPDHRAARRVLGYQKYRGGWHTAYEVGRLRSGYVRHEKFGWLKKAYVPRYEQGLRCRNGRWITAAEDARLHYEINAGWDVHTEHYVIRTNHSLEAGVRLGAKLENLYRIWNQMFIRYYASQAHVLALFDGSARKSRVKTRPFQVVFFRDRDDYNRTLRRAVPNIEISQGIYLEVPRQAYFFAGKEFDQRVLYHEATHQLFHQSRPVAPAVGRKANYWIIEGIAMFMESLRREGDYWTLGGFDDQRIYAGRFRLLKSNFYVPLAELATYGMHQVQADQRIAMLYSQAAGLTAFLVFYDQGRYRDALVAYLTAVYSGRDAPDTLAELAGTGFAELDQQYRQFMEASAKAEAGQ